VKSVQIASAQAVPSPLKAVADDMSRLETLQARVVSTAVMQALRADEGSQNLLTVSKQVAEMLGTAQQVDSRGIGLAVPSQQQLRQAKLVGLRQKSLQLLQKKYAREATHGDPLIVQQKRLELTQQFHEKIEALRRPTQLLELVASPTDSMSTTAASEYHKQLSMQMTSDRRLAWPDGITDAHKESALTENAATIAAMQVDHNWWRVYAPNTATTGDVRMTHQEWPWADDVDKNMVQNSSQPGWRATELRTSLIPSLRLPVQPVARPSDIHEFLVLPPDSMSLLSDSPLLRNPPVGVHQERNAMAAPIKSRTERDTRIGTMPESDASEWWLSYACTAPPKLSAIFQAKTDDSNRAFASHFALPQAMAAWSVIDPWSTATAHIDIAAASANAKEAASVDVGTASEFHHVDAGHSGPVRTSRLQEEDMVALELAIRPALDFYHSDEASDGAALQSLPIRREAAGLVDTAALAKPAETVSARVHAAYDALRRNYKDLEAIVDLPGSLHTLTKDVAARRIQRAWRGLKVIAAAARELRDRRQRIQAASLQKLAVVQQAMVDFCKVLENTAGVSLGVEPLQQSNTRINTFAAPVIAPEAHTPHAASADKMIGSMLAEALASINRSTVRVAHQVITGQTASIQRPPPLHDSNGGAVMRSQANPSTYTQCVPTPDSSTSVAAIQRDQPRTPLIAVEALAAPTTTNSPPEVVMQPTAALQTPAGVQTGVTGARQTQSRSAAYRSKINIDEFLIPAALLPSSNVAPAALVATNTFATPADRVRPALTSYANYGDVRPLIVATPPSVAGTPTLSTPALASSMQPDSSRSGTFGSTMLREGLVFAVDPVLLLPTESRYGKPAASTRK
jgi:hypothetical protein